MLDDLLIEAHLDGPRIFGRLQNRIASPAPQTSVHEANCGSK
jgi:hypothetical protein